MMPVYKNWERKDLALNHSMISFWAPVHEVERGFRKCPLLSLARWEIFILLYQLDSGGISKSFLKETGKRP